MTAMDYAAFDTISSEYIAASAELDSVFKARGIKDGDVPIISKSDEEALSAVHRMRSAQARLSAWLDANVA